MSGIPLPSSTPDANKPKESLGGKLLRKSKEHPLVPLGATMTCAALYLSARALRNGNPRLANRMFFWRVAFQGFTVAALIGGAMYFGDQDVGGYKGTPQEKMRQKAKEREAMWIEELERIELEAQRKRQQADDLKKRLSAEAAEAAEAAESPK